MIDTIRRRTAKLLRSQNTIRCIHTLSHDRCFQCRIQQGLRNRRIIQAGLPRIHARNRFGLQLRRVITRRQIVVDGHLTQSWEIPSRIARSQAELDFTEVGHHLANHKEPIVLHVDLQIVAEIGALGEKNKVRQRLASGHNLIRAILLNTELVLRIAHDRHARRKLTLARKGHRILDIVDLDRLCGQECHIATDLLEVERRHRDPRGELCIRHIDAVLIAIQKLELLGGHALLLAVLKDDIQVVGVIAGNRKRERVIIRGRLDNAIEVICGESNNELLRRVGVRLLLKLVGEETEMNQNCAGVVHGHHSETILIKYKAHLDKDTLQCLNEGANCGSLNRLSLHDQIRHSYYHLRGRFMKVVRGRHFI